MRQILAHLRSEMYRSTNEVRPSSALSNFCAGFKNEWGALMQHQSEVQAFQDEERRQLEAEKMSKYKDTLHQQLSQRKQVKDIENAERFSMNDRQILEENAKRFEQKEQMRILDEKLRGMNCMDQNRTIEQEKDDMRRQRTMAEKDQYNKQMNEITLYAKQREEQKKQWEDF